MSKFTFIQELENGLDDKARASIDLWIESGFNADKFWELMEPFRY